MPLEEALDGAKTKTMAMPGQSPAHLFDARVGRLFEQRQDQCFAGIGPRPEASTAAPFFLRFRNHNAYSVKPRYRFSVALSPESPDWSGAGRGSLYLILNGSSPFLSSGAQRSFKLV